MSSTWNFLLLVTLPDTWFQCIFENFISNSYFMVTCLNMIMGHAHILSIHILSLFPHQYF